MKKTVFTFITALFLFGTTYSQTENDLKDAISTVAHSYIGWQKSSCFYFTPVSYFQDENSGQIIGQKFTIPTNSEFVMFELVNENGKFPAAQMDKKQTFYLTWEGNKIKNIKGKQLYNYDYDIYYTSSGKIEKMVCTYGGEIQFNYEDDRLKEIISIGVHKGKSYTSSVRTILEETEAGFIMNRKSYSRGKPMKDKNIRQDSNCSCEKIGEKKYKTTHGWGDTVFHTFDDQERMIEKITHRKNGNQDSENKYFNEEGILIRKDVSKKEGGAFKEKQITIFEVPENTEGLEEWEKRKGIFKLNDKNELVYEAINTKYREKLMGVWTEWMPRQFCGVK